MDHFSLLLALCTIIGLSYGISAMLWRELIAARKDLRVKTAEFDAILRQFSEANNSFADKILKMEDRIANMEFRQLQKGAKNG